MRLIQKIDGGVRPLSVSVFWCDKDVERWEFRSTAEAKAFVRGKRLPKGYRWKLTPSQWTGEDGFLEYNPFGDEVNEVKDAVFG